MTTSTALEANATPPLRVGIAGLGAIGATLAEKLAGGAVRGAVLSGVAVRNTEKAAEILKQINSKAQICLSFSQLADCADIVVECAPSALLADITRPALKAGKKVLVYSVGALISNWDLVEFARQHKGQIIVPSGALLGLDAVAAAAEGTIHEVRMITRKPVRGLLGAPYLTQNNIDISNLKEATKIFDGTAREAAVGFPANLNVAVALSLAGVGPDLTKLEIWADPNLTRNTHRIVVNSDSALLQMEIQNIPSENPKTGRITALSGLSMLRKLSEPLSVGG
ncbi:MAG: aspartate dehydrogenase [Ferrovibrio sp.]|nr:MAG: aspartate dehydrogenase [Ferrovibrio sp.]